MLQVVAFEPEAKGEGAKPPSQGSVLQPNPANSALTEKLVFQAVAHRQAEVGRTSDGARSDEAPGSRHEPNGPSGEAPTPAAGPVPPAPGPTPTPANNEDKVTVCLPTPRTRNQESP